MSDWYAPLYEMLLSALGMAVAEDRLPAVPLPGFHLSETAPEEPGDYRSDLLLLAGEALGVAPRDLYALLEEFWWLEDGGVSRCEERQGMLYFWRGEK